MSNVIKTACICSLLMSALIASVCLLLGYEFWIYVFVSLLGLSLQLIVTSIFLRNNKHLHSSLFNFIFIISIPIFQALLTHYNMVNGLLLGHSLASLLYLIIVMPILCLSVRCGSKNTNLRNILYSYKSYYTLNAGSVFINSVSNQLLPFAIKFIYGVEILGLINILQRLIITPIGFILRIFIQVYNREFSFYLRGGEPQKARLVFIKTIKLTFICSSITFLILLAVLFGKTLVSDIILLSGKFGTWVNVYRYVPIMLLLLAFQILVIPVSQSLTFIKKHKLQFNLELIRLIGLITISIFSYLMGLTNYYFLFIYVLFQSIIYVCLLHII
ncbi:hypothetical protein HEL30_015320, partial [Escherichia coli]|nr:hypothetical protein [Escherichia coli]